MEGHDQNRQPREADALLDVAETNVILFGLHEWIEKSMRSGEVGAMLSGACDFAESRLGQEDVRFTFIGVEPKSLRIAAAILGRHEVRDAAIADVAATPTGGGAVRVAGRAYYPISGRGRILGYVSATHAAADHEASGSHVDLMMGYLTGLLGVLCENVLLVDAIRDASRRDPLTGILNRGALEEAAALILEDPGPALLVMADIDHFKQVNDTLGHAAGDEALRRVSALLCASGRGCDVVGRYGGEELTLVLAGTPGGDDLPSAVSIGERVRARVANADWSDLGLTRPLTVSVGVATRIASDHTIDAWFHRADLAMYKAKQTGRNRVVVWSPQLEASGFHEPARR